MLDIYDADGFLDRGRVLDETDSILDLARTLSITDRAELKLRLTDLLDECSEGFTGNPLDSPDMTLDYIRACRPAWSAAPPLGRRN